MKKQIPTVKGAREIRIMRKIGVTNHRTDANAAIGQPFDAIEARQPGDIDETIRGGDGQRLEQQRVDDGEERGVEPDADRQRGHRNEREPGALAQPPEREPDVGNNGFEQDWRL